MLNRVLMSSSKSVAVRDLAGFDKKVHRVPDRASAFGEKLVGELTKGELEEEVNRVAKRARDVFGYVRKDVNASVVAGGGSVITPGFEYAVMVGLDSESPAEVIWRRELRKIEGEIGGALDEVFAGLFDRLEMVFEQKQSVEDVIDRIEALRSKEIAVDYEDTDLSKCEIRVAGFEGRILVTRERLTVLKPGGGSPSELMRSFELAERMMAEQTEGRKRLPGG
jgi:hypothetical protein